MKNHISQFLGLALLAGAVSASAQVTIAPLTSFGTGGWLAPGSSGLVTGSADRGLAFAGNYVYYASGSQVFEIDPITGALIGGLTTGFSGGTIAVDALAAGGDGTLYVGNLTTSGTSPFKVYAYVNPADLLTAPTVVYNANPGGGSTRLGDTLAAIGSGTSTYLVAGSGAGAGGYTVINQGVGTAVGVAGTPIPGFNRGITFVNASQVIGSGTGIYYNTTFSGATGTLLGSPSIPDPAGNTADRMLSYNVLNGQALLAVQSFGDSHVSLYNMTDPNNPVYIAALNNTVSPGSNANGTGQLAWGAVTSYPDGSASQILYALSSGQGIQAFVVTVPEPATVSLIALGGLAALAFRNKLRR